MAVFCFLTFYGEKRSEEVLKLKYLVEGKSTVKMWAALTRRQNIISISFYTVTLAVPFLANVSSLQVYLAQSLDNPTKGGRSLKYVRSEMCTGYCLGTRDAMITIGTDSLC